MKNRQHYKLFAPLFAYPEEGYKEAVQKVQGLLNEQYPQAAEMYSRFAEFVSQTPIDAVEEVYTKTFHIQAICYLDLGYVIFGEDYKRGEFLVQMKREQDAVGNDCGYDLADNLSNVLTFFSKSTDDVLVEELAVRIVVPSLNKMLEEFAQSKMVLREKVLKKVNKVVIQQGLENGNIFQNAIAALKAVLEQDYSNTTFRAVNKVPEGFYGNFLSGCSTVSSCFSGSSTNTTTNINTTTKI